MLAEYVTGGRDPFYNLSYAAPLLSLGLAALPHWYTIYLAHTNRINGGWSNVNPRHYVSTLAAQRLTRKLTPLELTILRGQACQQNAFENVPLFLATLVWANLTKLEAPVINRFIIGYLVSRALFTVLYLKTTTFANSFARTAVFQVGIGWIISIWFKGAIKHLPALK